MIRNKRHKALARATGLAACALTIATLALPDVAAAEEKKSKIELTPLIGLSGNAVAHDEDSHHPLTTDTELDDAFLYGLMLGVPLSRSVMLELSYTAQETDHDPARVLGHVPNRELEIEQFGLEAMYRWRLKGVVTFVGGGVGVTRFDLLGFGSDTGFGINFGGGAIITLTPRLGLRVDGRFTFTGIDEDGVLLCPIPDCHGYGGEELSVQVQLRTGLTFRF